MPAALVDNDIVAKSAIYSLFGEVIAALGVSQRDIGVLGSTRYVLSPKRLKTSADGQEAARQRLTSFLNAVETIEPDIAETTLAAELEKAAIKHSVQLDVGESQLCAIALIRNSRWICTGDKRAIIALEHLRLIVLRLQQLDRKLICLEAIIRALILAHGHEFVRDRICGALGTDRALEICFHCHNSTMDENEVDHGIASYIGALSAAAPSMTAAF